MVKGKVTLDGKPFGPASITFVPKGGRAATGSVDAEGAYTLTTYKSGDGALIGTHRIAIVPAPPRGKSIEDESPLPKSPLPDKYNFEARSGLSFEVKSGENNQADFSLSTATSP